LSNADVIARGIVAGAKGVDDGAVDLHAAFEDDLLGLAAAGNSGLREDLLQAIAFGLVVRFRFGRGERLRHGNFGFLAAELLIAVG
jgi:hypothetical protein